MKHRTFLAVVVLGLSAISISTWIATAPIPVPPFDASAAVLIAPDRLVVADDEQNILRVYDPLDTDTPLVEFDLTRVPGFSTNELDIEGGAMLNDRLFWIGSHGRNKNGVQRPERSVLFSTTATIVRGDVRIEPKGVVCRTLVLTALEDDRYQDLGLKEATQLDTKKAPSLAPKKSGLNVEGLAPMPDGKGLFIGLRNPRPEEKALIVPFLNPFEVVDAGDAPKLGDPILLDLGGRGIRGMEWSPTSKTCLIIAGPVDDGKDFVLFSWSGYANDAPQEMAKLAIDQFTPETLVLSAAGQRALFLSDDGWKKEIVAGKVSHDESLNHFSTVLLDTTTWSNAKP